LESIPVADWMKRVFGRAVYRKFWGPLLKCKLGSCREEASAAFIWATIIRLYSTRDRNAGQKERLGYVRGGYRAVFLRLVAEIERMGGMIHTGVPVSQIESQRGGSVDFITAAGPLRFDAAIATVPSHTLAAIAPQLPTNYCEKLRAVKYLGMVCAVLVLDRPLTPFYVTNLTDEHLPFTGVIEMTNLVSLEETRGHHLVYLPKYTAPRDPLFEASDAEVWCLFRAHLRELIPDLEDSSIEQHFIFRERFVQPLPTLNYSDLVPSMDSGVPGLIVANTTQIVNSTLNNNEMVKIARRAVDLVAKNTGVQSERLSGVSSPVR
jgi:protoporphyrinogen oxidase